MVDRIEFGSSVSEEGIGVNRQMGCVSRARGERIAPREWMIALGVALVVVGLTLIPYALGYALARPGLEFTGVIMNPEDSQSYLAKMLQGYDGKWLYTIPFTTEDHAPAFIGGFYLALGHLARGLGLSLATMWHLARVSADVILFLGVFGFIAQFLDDGRARWTAYALALCGSGLGWLLFLLNQPYWLDWFPVDFKMPEAHLFFSALTFPHVAFGTTLILASFWFALRALVGGRASLIYAFAAGLANLLLAIVHPFLIYVVVTTLGLYWLYLVLRARRVLWRVTFILTIVLVLPAPLVLYYALTLATNPIFHTWDMQALTLSPPAPHYLIAYGAPLLLALVSLRHKRSGYAFLWIWILAVALLVYAPLNQQRRAVQGVAVPLAILATVGVYGVVLPWLERTRAFRWIVSEPRYSIAGLERLLIVLFIGAMSWSNLYILGSTALTAACQQPDPLFRPRAEIAAVDWLRAHSARDEVVLSAYETGNYIAARAGNRVVIGHWTETMNWERKFGEVARFYRDPIDDVSRRDWLAQYRVRYVWWGARERDLGSFDPERANYLECVFANEAARVYRVKNP